MTILAVVFCMVMNNPGQEPAASAALAAPRNLRCEYLHSPRGIDETTPRLSWEIVDPRRGAVQRAYQVIVADDPDLVAAGTSNLWDSGKVATDQSIQVAYAGQTLASRMQVYWRVRIWDQADQPSPWSKTARWSMGLLAPSDWRGQWIGDPTAAKPFTPARNGYHSELASAPEAAKWVAIDLAETLRLDAIRLFPARPYNWKRDEPGFLFPLRFRVELAHDPDFRDAKVVVDRTDADVANPGDQPQTYEFPPAAGRYVRLSVTRLRQRNAGEYGFALAEMQALAGGDNRALGRTSTASDSIENQGWSQRYLVDGDLKSHGAGGAEPMAPALLRKAFTVPAGTATITRATAYVTALGLYELRINGQRVGDHVLAPEWTDYHQRVQYQTYDVSEFVHAGQNALGVLLGDGWYAGRIGLAFIVPDGPPRGIYGLRPRFLMQLELEYSDGSKQSVVSDGTWRYTADGPVRVSDLLDGETCDARREMPGWDTPDFSDAAWLPVAVHEPPRAQLVAQPNEPIRIVCELTPVAVSAPQPGVYVYDLGQNMVGWCRLTLAAPAGTTVTLRHAEVLNEDGTVYTANLRSAQQTDQYTFAGGATETFEPHFTYHGFRYVEVTGLSEKPPPEALVGCVFHSAARDTGQFECSSPLLNRLMQNVVWTQRANMHSTPTDCPQRDERLGWMGDILAFAQTACFNMDMAAFFTKWIPDVREAQAADGRYPDFAPHPFDSDQRFSGVPAWGDAGVFVPWCMYRNYGDRRMLAEHFESARRWVDYVRRENPNLLWEQKRGNDYGDWLNADTLQLEGWPKTGAAMPKEAFATAFFARSAEIVALMAAELEQTNCAREYGELAAEIRQAFNRAYVQPDGCMQGDTQAGYAIALHFNLLPEELRQAAAERMVACFERYNGHISTGFHSTICLMNELTRNGYDAEAYRLLNNRTMPSWGYAIDHGATTIWERWDGYVAGRGFQNPGMNSFSHYAIGSVGEWVYRTVLGINLDPEVPAYKRFVIRPRPGGGLTWARGSYDSIHGRIASAWNIEDGQLTLAVTVPPNTSATVFVPTTDAQSVREGGRPVSQSAGVELAGTSPNGAVFRVAAGSYCFVAGWPE
ncbi:MAG: glycoside hydrolase family 78 protein [Planctomycetes bacterium]|nr:glycoside hydrolase family 78 protein [Planctomycetota bacterium]